MGRSIDAALFATVSVRYLDDLRVRCGAGHVANVERSLRRVLDACAEISVAALMDFRAARRAASSNRSANMDVQAVRTAIRWAHGLGLIDDNHVASMRGLPQRPADLVKRRRSLGLDEARRFMAAVVRADERRRLLARPDGTPQPRQEPLWRMFLEAGLRWREACSLEPGDVTDDAIIVRAAVCKSGRDRVIPVRRELAGMARDAVPFRAPQGGLWREKDRSNARVAFLGILGHADIPQKDERGRSLDIHALRRSCATRWHAAGVPIATIAKLLGHAKVETTYRHYIDDDVEAYRKSLDELVWKKSASDERPTGPG